MEREKARWLDGRIDMQKIKRHIIDIYIERIHAGILAARIMHSGCVFARNQKRMVCNLRPSWELKVLCFDFLSQGSMYLDR